MGDLEADHDTHDHDGVPGVGGGGSFTAPDLGTATILTPTGTAVWSEGVDGVSGRNLISVKFSGSMTDDLSVALWPIGGSSPRSLQTSWRVHSRGEDYILLGLVFTNGVVASSGVVFGNATHFGATPQFYVYHGGTIDNFDVSFIDHHLANHRVYGPPHMRLTWVSANTFKFEFSPDGISWTSHGLANQTITFTPTHVGLAVTNLAASPTIDRIVTFEYFADT